MAVRLLLRLAAVSSGLSDAERDFAGGRGLEAARPGDRIQRQRDLHHRQSRRRQPHRLRQSGLRAHHRIFERGGVGPQRPPAAGNRPRAARAHHRASGPARRAPLPRRAAQLPQGRKHVLERAAYRSGAKRRGRREPLHRRAQRYHRRENAPGRTLAAGEP